MIFLKKLEQKKYLYWILQCRKRMGNAEINLKILKKCKNNDVFWGKIR